MIAIQSIVLNANKSWTFTWSNVGASYYRVVLWGTQLIQTNLLSYTFSGLGYPNFPPPLEITYENTPALSEQNSPYLIMQWYGERACQEYLIQQYVGSVWVLIRTLQEVGSWIYTTQTKILLDETTYQYRVIAQDRLGNQASPRFYTRQVVTPPIPPVVGISYTKPNLVIS